jgi:hypothetical protein
MHVALDRYFHIGMCYHVEVRRKPSKCETLL